MIGQNLVAYFAYLISLRKKIYPLFIDVNHVCCYSYESNRIRKQEKFLKEADNFHS